MDRKGANKNNLKCRVYSNDCNNNYFNLNLKETHDLIALISSGKLFQSLQHLQKCFFYQIQSAQKWVWKSCSWHVLW